VREREFGDFAKIRTKRKKSSKRKQQKKTTKENKVATGWVGAKKLFGKRKNKKRIFSSGRLVGRRV